ncbi:hypothetical protein ACPPVT_18610 [Angustibacter sp. McL0619]|uniref:hypothetical protein n=1 Tax=Angustibacter sp. McL0619 TaxID=3415676 RepID=UPI003CF476E6
MRRHDTDVTSLVFGLIFVGIVGLWALIASDTMGLPDLTVLGPALLVVAGFIGLAATLGTSSRQRARAAAVSQAQPGPAQPAQPAQPAHPDEPTLIDELAPDSTPAKDVEPPSDPQEGKSSTS